MFFQAQFSLEFMLVVFAFNTFIVFVSTQTGLQMNKQKETQCKAFVRTKESIGAKIKNKFALNTI